MAEKKQNACFRTMIGGQALIEGIMMRGPDRQAVVVRTKDGPVDKVEELKLIKERYPVLGWPFVRGVVNFFDAMVHGMGALLYSAELSDDDEAEPDKFDLWLQKTFGSEGASKVVLTFTLVVGIGLSILLFFLLPTLIAGLFAPVLHSFFLRNLAEGAVRIVIFLGYLALCAHMSEMRRVFSYHGAEHKTIFCYEKGLPLTVENVRPQSRHHPRCGTSFLFVVMIISILVFGFVQWSNVWVRMGLRLILLPVVVGISYEINRYVGRHDTAFTRVLTAPGLWLQNFTTSEPDDSMIEIAIRALKLVIPEEKGKDAW